MSEAVPRRDASAPNAHVDGHIDDDLAVLLDRVCEQLPNTYTKQLVRDVARLKLWLGFEGSVRDYLTRRSGEYAAVPVVEAHGRQGARAITPPVTPSPDRRGSRTTPASTSPRVR
ncbi:MAG TPA: hypothetical protein VL308_21430 [Gemmatimonadaceae bacterium]|jgi:hypothetical protein|nr:hypothetical protein [Gemmatimonadaceae bacterium]